MTEAGLGSSSVVFQQSGISGLPGLFLLAFLFSAGAGLGPESAKKFSLAVSIILLKVLFFRRLPLSALPLSSLSEDLEKPSFVSAEGQLYNILVALRVGIYCPS